MTTKTKKFPVYLTLGASTGIIALILAVQSGMYVADGMYARNQFDKKIKYALDSNPATTVTLLTEARQFLYDNGINEDTGNSCLWNRSDIRCDVGLWMNERLNQGIERATVAANAPVSGEESWRIALKDNLTEKSCGENGCSVYVEDPHNMFEVYRTRGNTGWWSLLFAKFYLPTHLILSAFFGAIGSMFTWSSFMNFLGKK